MKQNYEIMKQNDFMVKGLSNFSKTVSNGHDSQEPCEPLVTSIWTETLYQADTGHQSVAATGNDFEGTAP